MLRRGSQLGSRCRASIPVLQRCPRREDDEGNKWNFLKKADRDRARRRIEEEKPYIVIGSPPCTMFSWLTKMNYGRMRREEHRKRLTETRVLLDFALEVYEMQVRGGRRFLHQHPASAGTWQEPQRSVILASVAKQDDLEDEEAGSGDMLDAIFGD